MRRTLRSELLISRKSVNVFLHIHTCTKGMFSRTNPLCAASCVTKDISPRFSPTIFYRDANSVLLRAHLCTAVLIGSMYNVESCVTISHLSPFLACVFSSRCSFTALTSTPLYSSSRLYAQKTLCSKVFKRARRSVQRARSTCTVSLVRRDIA